ncbi:hypothetical protein [Bacillus sp. HMF5848]|uniref:hypothetical protein n=1 Tax=Bacillus sp. HMF5848 TaxID=2495421 RepID=UPI001639D34E|nr:hypothetical protein [Bacillus sp. HMF5848]
MAYFKWYDPFDTYLKVSKFWERQLNGLLFMGTNNDEFVRLSNLSANSHARYVTILRKYQEFLATLLYVPTKNDVANVAKLSIQTEDKIDKVEEQLWVLQDKVDLAYEQIQKMVTETTEVMNVTKSFEKADLTPSIAIDETHKDLVAIKEELAKLQALKADLDEIKNMLEKEKLLQPSSFEF